MQPVLRQAIARIDIVQGDRSVGHGTGCLVAPDLLLTAMHVVANRQASPPSLLAGTIVLTFPTHRCEATVVEGRWDPRSDWALLRCATPPPGVRPVPLADSVNDGEEWETFGFPEANSRDGLAQLGTVENANGTFEGVAAYQLFSRQTAAGVGAPVKGLSGGPVIVDGALVGVFRSSLMREGQFNVAGTLYACPVETILARCADLLPVPDPCRGLPGLPRQPLPPAPYRFLERFTANDAEIFFGRNREIRELYDRVISSDSASIVLLYGQSGAGKSSFLDAGLLPRLASSHATLYVRRDRSKGLLRTLIDAMAQAFPSAPADSLAAAWMTIESSTSRPLVVILDQVEEAFTLPSPETTEVEDLVAAVKALVGSSPRPQGRLILGFRKEWLGEIQKPLDQHGLDYSKVFLEALDADAVTEVTTGLTHTRRLRDKYGLSVEDGLATSVASDLTADRESPVAPTLQVLLSRMWVEATTASSGSPAFTASLYSRINREGVLLTDFLDHQLAALAESARASGGSVADVVESGLALDVLRFHVSRLGTAEERSRQQLIDEYHRDDDVAWLVGELKRLYLLTEPAGDGAHTGATRLAHDTLAPAVRTRCDESLLPGQRARRLLEGRAGEWAGGKTGTPLDWRDLMRVEQGATGMRALHPDEERMVEASRAVRRQDTARRRMLRFAAAAAVLIVLGASGAAWLFREQNLKDQAWSSLISLGSSIPMVLDMQPALGLALAIDVVDRSLALNNGVPIAFQESLARALDTGRERFVWTLPAAGTATAISRDGRVAVGLASGVIHIYRPGSTDPEQIIPAGEQPIAAVSFSDDGELIAAARGTQGIGVWRRNGQPVDGLPQPLTNDRAQNVKFVPGSQTLVALTGAVIGPNFLHLFDLPSRTIDTTPMEPRGAEGGHRPLEVIRDEAGQIVVATEFLDSIYVSRAAGAAWTSTERTGSRYEVRDLALRRNVAGRVLLSVAAGSDLTVVSLESGDTQTDAVGSGPQFSRVAFGANTRTLITAAGDGMVRVFDRDGRPVPAPALAASDIASMAVSHDGEWAAVTGGGAPPRLSIVDLVGVRVSASASWDLHTPSDGDVASVRSAMAFTPSGQLVAAGADDVVRAWNLELAPGQSVLTSRPAFDLSPTPLWTQVEVDAAGTTIAILGAASGIKLFGPDGTSKGSWPETSGLTAAAMSPDGRLLVTGSRAGAVTVVDVPSGKTISQVTVLPVRGQEFPRVSAVAIDPHNDRFIAAFSDGQVRAYRRDGTELATDASADGVEISALLFTLKGEVLAGTSRGEVRTIFINAGERPRRAVRVFAGRIRTFAQHPSGSPLFVGGSQGLRALDWPGGSLMDLPMSTLTTPLHALAVSPDGRLLVAAKAQGGFLFWRAGWQEWLAAACDRLQRHELFTTLAKPGVALDTETSVRIEPYRAFDACRRRAPAGPP